MDVRIGVHCDKRHAISEAEMLIHVHVALFELGIGEEHGSLTGGTSCCYVRNHSVDTHPEYQRASLASESVMQLSVNA